MTFRLENETALGDRRVRKRTLTTNGLTVLTLPDAASPVFAYHSWVRVGSRHELGGRTGLAHLFEHMMFKATRNLGEGEFDRLIEGRGGQTNAATWVDWTYYHEALPATPENLELCVRLEADRLENLVLTSDQLESEREVVINERLYRVEDDPDGRTFEELYSLAFGNHPYGWPTIGWMRDIENISLEDCLEFYHRYYSPNNTVLVVAGGFDEDAALDQIARRYSHLEPQALPAEVLPPLEPVRSPRRRVLHLPGANTERVLVGFHSPAILDPDLAAVEVAVEILASGESSRLHRRLVADDETASSVDGWMSHFQLPGLTELSASVRPGEALEEVESAILEEIAALGSDGPTADEICKAHAQLEASVFRNMESATSVAYRLGHYEVTAGDYRELQRAIESVRQVSAEDVQRVAAQTLCPTRRSVVLLRRGPAVDHEEDQP